MPRIKKLIVDKFLTDQEVKDLKGCFIDESYMNSQQPPRTNPKP